jgi:phage FluMu protein gp41
MFRQFLSRMAIGPEEAPDFHYYLNRHIHLDEDFHGPLSMRLLTTLCGDDPKRIEEAEAAAEEAICARIRFWDGVLNAIESRRAG